MKKIPPQSGLTIIELLLAVGVGSLVIAAVVMLTGRGFSISREQFEQARNTEDARIQVQRMSSLIRNARSLSGSVNDYWLRLGNANELAFYVDEDNDGAIEQVRYVLQGTEVKRGLRDPYNAATESIQTIATGVRNTAAGQPLFTYYSGASSVTFQYLPIPTGIKISRVGIHLVVDANDTNSYPAAIKIDTVVAPRIEGLSDTFGTTQCADGVDNDVGEGSDGKIDYGPNIWNDPQCNNAADNNEWSNNQQCNDGFDNDFDGTADKNGAGGLAGDPDCASAGDKDESLEGQQ